MTQERQSLSRRCDLGAYKARLREMSNRELVDESGSAILAAAVMARMRSNDGWDDDRADACYAEAQRRGNSDLYQRGYNSAVRSQGHTDLAREPTIPVDYREDTP